MKILLVADFHHTARENALLQAFPDLGHTLVPVPYSSGLDAYGFPKKTTIMHRVLWKLGVLRDDSQVNERIWKTVLSERPDVVWIYKGNMVRPGLLRRIKAYAPSTVLVSYAEDDMYAWHNRTWSFTRALKFYDIVFTTKSYNAAPNELPRLGARRVVSFDNSYDRSRHKPVAVTLQDRERLGGAVGFIGSYEPERARSMLFLASQGVAVRVWGNGWENCTRKHPNLRVECRPVEFTPDGLEYCKAICSTDINLCFLRKINRDQQTGRTMEIPACGGFMMAERTPEHARLFEDGREAVFFSSDDELLERVRYYLAHPQECAAIAAAGRERCLRDDYSYHGRLAGLIGCVQEMSRFKPS